MTESALLKDVYIWIGHGTTEMVTLIQGFLVTSGGEFVAGSSRGYGVIIFGGQI